ncbi:MAG: Rid family detoxifying hydrolase [Xanthomonadales bacterium]|nr:Rid family detoxifying hydrolase [Xanthomonadales bacterium]
MKKILFILLLTGVTATMAAEIQFLNSEANAALELPFSEATRVGDTLYLSGQIGNKPGTLELAEGGVGPETEQTLKNIQATLERHGSSLSQVAKCTVFLADIAEWPAVNKVYKQFFKPPYPARSAVAGSGLAIGARVEIECIAVVD